MQHSNDYTGLSKVAGRYPVRGGEDGPRYLDARIGEEVVTTGVNGRIFFRAIVTAEDIDRGYLVAKRTASTFNVGASFNPVFLRPRRSYSPGDGWNLSESTLAPMPTSTQHT